MGANWSKAGASRITIAQPISWAGSGTSFTTKFSATTYQIRVISPIAAWIAVLDSTSTMFSTSTFLGQNGGPSATFIAANTASGDYFTVNPFQILGFSSTSTSTSGLISISELS